MPEDVSDFYDKLKTLSNIRVRGLMTMAPRCENKEEYLKYFKLTKEIFDKLFYNDSTAILSMGMSESYMYAIEAGAKFIVSPGFNPEIVKYCQSKGCPIVPGINNPSGIEAALELGLKTVKFFPAEQSGGLAMIKAMSAPYGGVTFMPTGGVSPANVNDYLAFNKIVCCGGSWMVKPEMISAGDFDGITKLVREAVDTMLGFKFKHIGINPCGDTAEGAAVKLDKYFSFEGKVGSKSIFSSPEFELMMAKGPGTNGHIAIQTNNVDRAVYHLERRGVKFDYSTATYDDKGNMKFIYLADEINGFAYHLVK